MPFFERHLRRNEKQSSASIRTQSRRLNNRELANSVADVPRLEDIGTNHPTANLPGDTPQDGFDTNGDARGMSQ